MQVAQTVVVGVVYDDRIGVGYVYAVLDDGCGHQYVELAVDEVHDELLELFRRHLAVPDSHTGLRAETRDETLQRLQILHAVIDEIYLSAARELLLDGITYDIFRECMHLGDDGLAVGRRCGYHRQVARAHERELQRARYRCCRER